MHGPHSHLHCFTARHRPACAWEIACAARAQVKRREARQGAHAVEWAESTTDFLRQMGYREYARYLSFHFPFTHERSLLEHVRAAPWRYDQSLFKVRGAPAALATRPAVSRAPRGLHSSVDHVCRSWSPFLCALTAQLPASIPEAQGTMTALLQVLGVEFPAQCQHTLCNRSHRAHVHVLLLPGFMGRRLKAMHASTAQAWLHTCLCIIGDGFLAKGGSCLGSGGTD